MRNKNKFTSIEGDYTKLPNRFFNIPCPYARLVFLAMLSCGEEFNPGLKQLVTMSGISINSVRRGITTLLDLNIITRYGKYQVGKCSNRYEFVDPPKWKLK